MSYYTTLLYDATTTSVVNFRKKQEFGRPLKPGSELYWTATASLTSWDREGFREIEDILMFGSGPDPGLLDVKMEANSLAGGQQSVIRPSFETK